MEEADLWDACTKKLDDDEWCLMSALADGGATTKLFRAYWLMLCVCNEIVWVLSLVWGEGLGLGDVVCRRDNRGC